MKPEMRKPKAEGKWFSKEDPGWTAGTGAGGACGERVLVTRVGLAVALGVSLRTVDRMVAAGDVAPVRVRGWLVRFYVPDVIECLKREQNKFGRRADTNFTNSHEEGRATGGHEFHELSRTGESRG